MRSSMNQRWDYLVAIRDRHKPDDERVETKRLEKDELIAGVAIEMISESVRSSDSSHIFQSDILAVSMT